MAHYPGRTWRDDDSGEVIHRPAHVGIKVDAPLPPWWPYVGTDRFAPSVEEVCVVGGEGEGREPRAERRPALSIFAVRAADAASSR